MRIPSPLDYYFGTTSLSSAIGLNTIFEWIIGNLTVFFVMTMVMDSNIDRLNSMFERSDEAFDFIVVGAGASGCVLANRLSEKHRVLLLEAGGAPNPFLYIPVLFFNNQNRHPYDWRHRTVPQQNSSFGTYGNTTYWPAGKGIGGGSLLNAMIYVRGFVQGFDKMASRTGHQHWSMRNVLKYYKSLEDYNGWFDDGSHGKGGAVRVGKGGETPFLDNLLRAGKELGYEVLDPNPDGPVTERFSPMDVHTHRGRRWDVYSAFIEPIKNRKNLVVRKYSQVTQVLLEGPDNTAYAVKYERHGKEQVARVNKEIILSASAIKSAQILLLSGIGPKEHLDEVGIRHILELPVGSNLRDKYGSLIGPFTLADGTSFRKFRDLTAKSWFEFAGEGTGPYASSRLEATYTIRSPIAKRANNINPDVFTYILASSPDEYYARDIGDSIGTRDDIFTKYHDTVNDRDAFFQLVTIPKPYGKGYLKLKDSNPHSSLILDPKYLQDRRDVDVLVEGIKFGVKLVEETKSFKEINGSMLTMPYPGCEGPTFRSDEYYECLARHTTTTAYKYCSTAPMGKDRTDSEAVVDPYLRVFGTKGLRVVDSAVLKENEVSTNQVTCQMVGALAADFILDYWDNHIHHGKE